MSSNSAVGNFPSREDTVLRYVLDRCAETLPESVFVLLESGRAVTFAELHRDVRSMASALQKLGVRQGDHVLSWQPNGLPALKTWFAANYLGAVYVPMNTAYKGGLLAHAVDLSDAQVAVCHPDLIGRLKDVPIANLGTVVATGPCDEVVPGVSLLGPEALNGDPDRLEPLMRPIEPWDAQSIIFTSGTTGASKGVLSSYAHLANMSGDASFPYLTSDDRFLVALPLFHVGATCFVYGMLLRGASIALVSRFQTSEFWRTIRETGSTATLMLGVMAEFLLKETPSERDRDHSLRTALMVPLSKQIGLFSARFGSNIYTCFNQTETNMPIVSEANPTDLASCGHVRASDIEVRLVDENDLEVPDGEIGEMVIRSQSPWTLMSGYYKNPEATAKAWRNGWYHTGDSFRRLPDGEFYFVDRKKDAIRRRGENVSSFEVEVEVISHPSIREAAAVAVPSELSEDEILICVAPNAGAVIDPEELVKWLSDRMAHFMVPRFVRVVDELPKTPTNKVQKNLIRNDGVTSDTWDREAAGVVIQSERLRAQ